MLLTEYLDTIENTEQEQLFLEKLSEIKEHLGQAAKAPFVGKMMRALVALGEVESIEEFKQSEHYESIKGLNITVSDLEKGHFSIHPGREQLTKMAKISAVVAVVILLLLFLCRRRRCSCD